MSQQLSVEYMKAHNCASKVSLKQIGLTDYPQLIVARVAIEHFSQQKLNQILFNILPG